MHLLECVASNLVGKLASCSRRRIFLNCSQVSGLLLRGLKIVALAAEVKLFLEFSLRFHLNMCIEPH